MASWASKALATGLLAAGLIAGGAAAQPVTGLRTGAVLPDYPPLADASEILRRVATPLSVETMRANLAASGKALDERVLEPSQERFVVYAPATPPAAGYGLLVFVTPWNDARLPQGWAAELDRAGVIFAAAAGSGNEANTVGRREPLALIAWSDVSRAYRIDPARVYVAGFSGGAHVALRLALAFPDVFRGALLDAGSDPIGDSAAPLPPAELFARFQQDSRLVLVTGSQDQARVAMDDDAIGSFHRWCVEGVTADQVPNAGHQVLDPAGLRRALALLDAARKPETARLAACRATVARTLEQAFDEVARLTAQGRRDEARKALVHLDARFGGLAAPRSVTLWRELGGS